MVECDCVVEGRVALVVLIVHVRPILYQQVTDVVAPVLSTHVEKSVAELVNHVDAHQISFDELLHRLNLVPFDRTEHFRHLSLFMHL